MLSDPSDETLTAFGPWNPGIESTLPRAFLPLATVFRPENVSTRLADAEDLAGVCGLAPQDLVAFRPERLAVHEVLVRVTADLSVPTGQEYADLGVNFRRMTERILATAIRPRHAELRAALDGVDARASARMERVLDAIFAPPPPPARKGWLSRFRAAPAPGPAAEPVEERALRILAESCERAAREEDSLARAACEALRRAVAGIIRQRGRLLRDRALILRIAAPLVSNGHGSREIGRLLDPWFREAALREGYRVLTPQARPIVMNVKGASASGKSTMRPLQRALAGRIGADWSDFALISPDIWRKFLLDYASLGPARRYAGTLTGHEVEIVNTKLDRYMAAKARQGRMSHLLIDRFRFDSFAADSRAEDGSQLLTRFGDRIYMLFMITPPDATVERAWLRGERFGRYKAVDDLLAHNVEAFTGMPRLFFTWALKPDRRVHTEFLDNSVAQGCRPRTVAFGWNGEMTILDPARLLDIERFRRINVDAGGPPQVYPGADAMAPSRNTGFLRDCARKMRLIRFAEPATGLVYARFEGRRLTCADRDAFARALGDPEIRAAFAALAEGPPEACPDGAPPEHLVRAETHTLGAWGPDPEEIDAPASPTE
ncbi:conserved hypothetical protein [Methylobacterium sp. 4-46]|uniref:hypothetical protein n=1 Tax=unclassified Methylobacterium TaxID=2615210 RepID=UPI000165CA62|nr:MULTISPECIES: hypothetical protein [Methylobacterium]ACA17009.1 conserved hypothetical protein [Methylobacterium sp. 4-46]WFT82698.1 hypothetical protein QA634_13035 [Methylobacterium nodulans]